MRKFSREKNWSIDAPVPFRMASPHVAGLAAYMLSTDWAKNAALVEAQELLDATPGYKQLFFGARNAPIPKEPIVSPKALKKAMLKIATKGVLRGVSDPFFLALEQTRTDRPSFGNMRQDLGAGSPNILIFNNYTSSASSSTTSHGHVLESALVESYLEDLEEELAALRSEIRHEVEEMNELVHELVN